MFTQQHNEPNDHPLNQQEVGGAAASSHAQAPSPFSNADPSEQSYSLEHQIQKHYHPQDMAVECQQYNIQEAPPPAHASPLFVPPERPASVVPSCSSFDSHDDGAAVTLNTDNFPRRVNLKTWIAAALHSMDDNTAGEHGSSMNKKKVSSGAYLTCALTIAHSLADQLCKLEEAEGGDMNNNVTLHSQAVPLQGLHWPNFVTVYLNDGKANNGNKHKQDDTNTPQEDAMSEHVMSEDEKKDDLPKFHPTNDSKPDKDDDWIFDLLPKIFQGDVEEDDQDHSVDDALLGTQAYHPHEGGDYNQVDATGVDYLDISSAKLRMEKHDSSTIPPRCQDKKMHMHYLGLILFELFSGGKSCIPEEKLRNDPLAGPPNAHIDSYPILDIANAMSIIDDIGDDDELFGGGSGHLDVSARSNKKKSSRMPPASSITVEPLKLLGLPIALCDLVGNMIDCSRGDFSGDETYSCMMDVKRDLALMRESPDIYLRDLDLDLVCKVGLQMDDRTATWYGRDSEFAHLKETYLRSISDTCEAAIICGHHGIGKSQLAQEFAQYAKEVGGDEKDVTKGCILLSGKFDKLQQSQPFSPVASAFNKYCDWLSSSDENASIAEKMSSELQLALGREAYALVKVIPSLSKIIGDKTDMDESDAVEDVQKRLRYLFSQFTEVISRSHDAPLVLFIDNLQWADLASIALIKQILLVAESSGCGDNNKFFFLGCFTHEMGGKDHPIWTMLDSVSDFGVKTTKIELDCLDNETVNSMVSKKLNMLPRLARPLTDIVYHKTKGNPFFVRQLMIELSKEGLLRPSLSRCRWVWEEEKIQDRELPDDVVLFMTASLNRLSSEILSALCTLSCFGSCSDRSLVELENELGLSLSEPLDRAVAEGFLNKKDEKYYFVDDRVQEAAYNLMKPEERCLHHFSYGLSLCTVAERNNDDGLFLIAVGQINLGGPKSVADDDEGLRVAKHNLTAGKKAMDMSDFFSAYWFFDYGISYLKKNHWEKHYQLSLELFNDAAQCALIIGEHDSLSILSEQVMRSAKCIEDKLQIFHITVRFLISRRNLAAAIECGIDALANLGEDFPEEVTPDVVIHFVEDTKEMLDGMSDDDLINYELMTDSNKIMAMKFLAKLSEPLYISRPSDQPIVVFKMVQLSLEHGMSPISPLAFVTYGSFLASMGDIREGYRYARIAKALLNKVSSRQAAGETIAYSAQLLAYAEPMQSALEFHIEGGKAAMSSGATVYALLNALLYDIGCYWSGKKLSSVKIQLDQTIRLIKQNKSSLLMVSTSHFILDQIIIIVNLQHYHGASVCSP